MRSALNNDDGTNADNHPQRFRGLSRYWSRGWPEPRQQRVACTTLENFYPSTTSEVTGARFPRMRVSASPIGSVTIQYC